MVQVRCRVHPNQFVTNFCLKSECMMELCATCVGLHTDMHSRKYQNISQTVCETKEKIDLQRVKLEQQRNHVLSYDQKWNHEKKRVFQIVKNAKNDVLNMVQKTFAEIWTDFERKIHEEGIRLKNSKGETILNFVSSLNRESQQLFNLQKQLMTVNCPQAIKCALQKKLPESTETLQMISQDYRIFQQNKVGVDYRLNCLNEAKQAIIKNVIFCRTVVESGVKNQESRKLAMSKSCANIMRDSSPVFNRTSQSFASKSKPKISVTSMMENTRNSDFMPTRSSAKISRKSNIFMKNPRYSTQIRG